MNNIVGNILQDLLSKEGAPTKKDFARMLGIAEKTLYNILNGDTQMVLNQIVKASTILNYDILRQFIEKEENYKNAFEEPKEIYVRNTGKLIKIPFTINLAGNLSAYDNFSELLKSTKEKAEELGFIIM